MYILILRMYSLLHTFERTRGAFTCVCMTVHDVHNFYFCAVHSCMYMYLHNNELCIDLCNNVKWISCMYTFFSCWSHTKYPIQISPSSGQHLRSSDCLHGASLFHQPGLVKRSAPSRRSSTLASQRSAGSKPTENETKSRQHGSPSRSPRTVQQAFEKEKKGARSRRGVHGIDRAQLANQC